MRAEQVSVVFVVRCSVGPYLGICVRRFRRSWTCSRGRVLPTSGAAVERVAAVRGTCSPWAVQQASKVLFQCYWGAQFVLSIGWVWCGVLLCRISLSPGALPGASWWSSRFALEEKRVAGVEFLLSWDFEILRLPCFSGDFLIYLFNDLLI